MVPIHERVEAEGRYPYPFRVFALSEPVGPVTYDRPPAYEVTMLVVPERGV